MPKKCKVLYEREEVACCYFYNVYSLFVFYFSLFRSSASAADLCDELPIHVQFRHRCLGKHCRAGHGLYVQDPAVVGVVSVFLLVR